MPAPPTPEELWPQRLKGVSTRRAAAMVMRAACAAGEAMKRAQRLPRNSEVTADPIAVLIAADARLVRLIGAPVAPRPSAKLPSAYKVPRDIKKRGKDAQPRSESVWPDAEATSWISIERDRTFPAIVRLGFRGARVTALSAPDDGEALKRKERRGKGQVYTLGVAKKQGWKKGEWAARLGVESDRLYSFEAFCEAADRARAVLEAAGCVVASRCQVRELASGRAAVAEFWVRRLSPKLTRGTTIAR